MWGRGDVLGQPAGVWGAKWVPGKLLGAAGAIEEVATVLADHHDIVPPTINYDTVDPECDLDCVPNTARNVGTVRNVLKNSFGFGRQNAVLGFRRFR